MGVLFEISIVCHVLCSWFWWVAGVSPVLGVVLVVRLVFWFSGSGLFVVLVPRGSSARLCGGAGGGLRVVPGSGVDVVRPVSIDYRVLVGGWACFFRSALSCSSVPVLVFVVLSGLGFWGVSGWVGVFSPASVVRPGPVWVGVVRFLFGEFDPGSGRTLAACLTHASRTVKGPACWFWMSGERVSIT